MEIYEMGPSVSLAVSGTSIGFLAATLKPTTGDFVGKTCDKALIQAAYGGGGVYMEAGGSAATSASFALSGGDSIQMEGYSNLTKLRFLKMAGDTTVIIIPMFR